jgi:hypothetical protein
VTCDGDLDVAVDAASEAIRAVGSAKLDGGARRGRLRPRPPAAGGAGPWSATRHGAVVDEPRREAAPLAAREGKREGGEGHLGSARATRHADERRTAERRTEGTFGGERLRPVHCGRPS